MPYADPERQRAFLQQWYGERRSKLRQTRKNHYAANKNEIHKKRAVYRKVNSKRLNEVAKRAKLLKIYGLTLEEYEALRLATTNCPICGILLTKATKEKQSGTDAHLDHNHQTGAVRGFICSRCNKGLGCFSDDSEILCKAINWVKQNLNPVSDS